jgi:ubiquinone/menaquinone biosynthesis C-methylase UbiE
MSSREWNADIYHQVSSPQVSWGKKVLARIHLRGDEHVMDAGCGTGRLTRDLLEALPRGQVTAVDVSENMLRNARQHLTPEFGERVHFVQADLQHLQFDRAFDGIFSTASFHWIKDHDQLFAGLFRALKPGGWLCAQCGGEKNLKRLLDRVDRRIHAEPYCAWFADFPFPWEYSNAETAARRLRCAGFADVETGLEEAPTQFPSAVEFERFVKNVILHRHLERIPTPQACKQLLAQLTHQAADDNPPFLLDYWRLNVKARRPE